jgi:formylglycine-generating enzyme required for sulfatase activity
MTETQRPQDNEAIAIKAIDFEPASADTRRFYYRFHWLHGVIAIFGTAAVISAWFVLIARSVLIDVEPITAEVQIEGGFALQLGQRRLMRSGDYEITLRNEGFHDLVQALNIDDAAAQTHSYTLAKLPGIVTIASMPIDGARVLIDGVDVGKTPLAELDVEPGTHTLTLSAERYLDASQTIEIEGRRQRQEFTSRLDPAWATVSFTTVPAGAELLVDGESQGTTPLNAEILQGRREVMLKLSGFKAWQERVELSAGENRVIPAVTLEPADGLAFIQSTPTGASVTIGGEFKGQTPLEVALAPNTPHDITFFKNGYESAQQRLVTQPERESQLSVTLTPVLSNVSIETTPNGAELFIDGQSRGNANQTLALMAISQRVEIRKPGFVPYEAEFTPRPGLEQVLRVELQSLEEARIAAIEPLIVNPAGQRMSLLNPDAFTMGASRREAGRRPNEAIRDVVLERPFYLSFNEVTNAQFRLFDSEHSSGTSNGMTLNNEQQPVIRIRWEQAAAFCNWLSEQEDLLPFYELAEDDEGELQFVSVNPESHGYRLPTEAEWAWAARRDNTAQNGVRKYSWEGELPPPAGAANLADVSTRAFLGDILFDYDDRTPLTASVGSFAPNQHGFYDLAGNVAEWVHDFYGASGSLSVERDPLGPEAGQFRVIRGSSWAHGSITELRLSFRDFGEQARDDVGFRVARYLEEE